MEEPVARRVRWCKGLRSVGVRRLEAAEMDYLRSETRKFGHRYWLPAALGVAAPTSIALALVAFSYGSSAPVLTALGVTLLISGIYILPTVALLGFRDIKKLRKLLRLDLDIGLVERFEAVSDSQPGSPEQTPELGSKLESMEVLPGSMSVLKMNGVIPPKRLAVEITETAPPSSATRTLKPAASAGRTFARRRLTADEQVELAATVQRLKKSVWITCIVIAIFVPAMLHELFGISHGVLSTEPLTLHALNLFVLVAAASAIYRLYRLFRNSRLLTKDLHEAELVSVAEHTAPFETFEVLRHSKLIWSKAAQPSLWRHSRAQIRRSDYLLDLKL